MKNFKHLVKVAGRYLSRNKSNILIGMGLTMCASAVASAIPGTIEAQKCIDATKEELEVDELTTVEVIKSTWHCYLPTVTMTAIGFGCILGANHINAKRTAALVTAYNLSETALKDFKEAAEEVAGPENAKKIRERAAEKKLERSDESDVVILDGEELELCYDAIGGGYFKTSVSQIQRAELELNRMLIYEYSASLNDLYDLVGKNHTKLGSLLGWNSDSTNEIKLEVQSKVTPKGKPCLVLDANIDPKTNFYSFA